eukprot:7353917-Heterocapsa_arctica.AAC.1
MAVVGGPEEGEGEARPWRAMCGMDSVAGSIPPGSSRIGPHDGVQSVPLHKPEPSLVMNQPGASGQRKKENRWKLDT